MHFEKLIGSGYVTDIKLLEKRDESLALQNGLVVIRAQFILIVLFAIVPHGFELLLIFIKNGYNRWFGKDLFGEFFDGFLDLVFFLLVLEFFEDLFSEDFLFLLFVLFLFFLVLFAELSLLFGLLYGFLALLFLFDFELVDFLLFFLLLSLALLSFSLFLGLLFFLLFFAVLLEFLLLFLLIGLLLLLELFLFLLFLSFPFLLLLFLLLLFLLSELFLFLEFAFDFKLSDFSQLFLVLSLYALVLFLLDFLFLCCIFRSLAGLAHASVVLVLFLYALGTGFLFYIRCGL